MSHIDKINKNHHTKDKGGYYMQSTELPTWDLSDLYKGIDDPLIESNLVGLHARAVLFDSTYRGKINSEKLEAEFLLIALREHELIIQGTARPHTFAELLHSTDMNDPKLGAFAEKMKAEGLEIDKKLFFFELELLQLPDGMFEDLKNSPELQQYRHYLTKLMREKPHRLQEREEQIFADLSRTGNSAFSRLFDEEHAATKCKIVVEGKQQILTQGQILRLLYAPNRTIRKRAARSLTTVLRRNLKRMTFISNTLAEDKRIRDTWTHFESPEASRHLANETDQAIVDTMISVIVGAYPIVHDFYELKRKALGLRQLYDYDRYAPIAQIEKTYSFDEARRIVLGAFGKLSPVFADTAALFFERKWIEAQVKDGKKFGAYSCPISGIHPYVFLNYTGSLRDVVVLGHELGHGVHGYLSREQSEFNSRYPLTVAETASIFGEMLVFSDLKDRLHDKKEKFSFQMSQIDNIFATVFRQNAMYRFEQEFHRRRREEGELKPEEINAIWRKTQAEMFGDSVRLTSDHDIWWSYIPHFIHTPFYVYAYGFGQLLVLSLYAQYQCEGEGMVEKYLDLLRAGGSRAPNDLLAPFDIDLRKREFWEGGIDIIRGLVEEAKQSYEKIK